MLSGNWRLLLTPTRVQLTNTYELSRESDF